MKNVSLFHLGVVGWGLNVQHSEDAAPKEGKM